ncbi:hypothetical protein ACKKBG_A33225 [Auxenochlorella protothecoides x Auxenochlorella symbiontica]
MRPRTTNPSSDQCGRCNPCTDPDDVQHQLQCFLGFIPCSIKGGLNSRRHGKGVSVRCAALIPLMTWH